MTNNLDSSQSAQKPVAKATPPKNPTQGARANTTAPAGKAPAVKSPAASNPAPSTPPASTPTVKIVPAPAAKNADEKGPQPAKGAVPGTKPPAAGSAAEKSLPGEFGRQAALSAQKDPNVLKGGSPIFDPSKPLKADLFAYSETDLAQLDTNRDGHATQIELMRFFNHQKPDQEVAQLLLKTENYFAAMDADGSKGIDAVENAEFILYQMIHSVDMPTDPSNPSVPSNKLSKLGVDIVDKMIMKNPETVRETLEAALAEFGMQASYQKYRAQVEEAKKQK